MRGSAVRELVRLVLEDIGDERKRSNDERCDAQIGMLQQWIDDPTVTRAQRAAYEARIKELRAQKRGAEV